MDRRALLKTMSITLGYAVVSPTLLQILSSCEKKHNLNWKPKLLSQSEAFVVEQLSNLIIPSSNTVGAIDVNVPKFIDLILIDLIPKNEKKAILKGAKVFQSKFKELFKKDVLKGTNEEFSLILSTYFNIDPQKQERIFELIKKSENEVINKELYFLYKYLIFIRTNTLYGYYTSKEVGTEILNYNPIPGHYNACVPVFKVENIAPI